MKLTLKQKRFADEYIVSGNIEQSALIAGYSKNYARKRSSELLANVGVKSYLEERLKELEDKTIAKQDEVLKILTKHARRKTVEYNITKDGEIVNTPTSVANSIKAAELLGKRYKLFTDKVELDADVDMELDVKIDYGD